MENNNTQEALSWYKNCSEKKIEKGKERRKQYYHDNKERLKEMARDQYEKLSQEE